MTIDYHAPFYETCCEGDDEANYSGSVAAAKQEYAKAPCVVPDIQVHPFISETELSSALEKFLPRPGDPLATHKRVNDNIIPYIHERLCLYGKGEWSLRPRTFAILWMLGRMKLMDLFVAENRLDSFLPYSDATLPAFIKGADLRAKFLELQKIVLCREPDVTALEECGKHLQLLAETANAFFVVKGRLGTGGYAIVDHVYSLQTLVPYARKKIFRGHTAREDQHRLKQFQGEIQALKRLSHTHIVNLVGSYNDETTLCFMMWPVAEMNLAEYLSDTKIDPVVRARQMRSFFGCLATALAYLHRNSITHNDIKPQNILIDKSEVYFTDFGTSKIWEDGQSTTRSRTRACTTRYRPPETDTDGRNRASDIWSLGCVFLEMATVLLGKAIGDMNKFLEHHGTRSWKALCANITGISQWVAKLRGDTPNHDLETLDWALQMLQLNKDDRLTAAQLRGQIIDVESENAYICPRCASPEGLESTESFTGYRKTSAGSDKPSEGKDIKLVTASTLGIAERAPDTPPISSPSPKSESGSEQQVIGDEKAIDTTGVHAGQQRRGIPPRRQGAAEDHISTDANSQGSQSIRPEPLRAPPILRRHAGPLPSASPVPSYHLAGLNHLSDLQINSGVGSCLQVNIFVYGRLTFPSMLRAVASSSLDGAYSPILRRRLYPDSEDWAGADRSIERACQIMTPARLRGYDRWRPRGLDCAAIHDSYMTKLILQLRESEGYDRLSVDQPGELTGFLVTGIRKEAVRYLDVLFSTVKNLMHLKLDEEDDEDERYHHSHRSRLSSCLERREVTVEVELDTGELASVLASTYVWSNGISDIVHEWDPDRYVRGSSMHSMLQETPKWRMEEQAIATKLNMAFATVGDYLLSAITSNNMQDLASLLKTGSDPNAECRLYGTPLQAAVSLNREAMVVMLLDHGAAVNATGGQYGSPLIAAAYTSRKSIMKLLLHRRAKVFASDKVHINALYQAVAHSDYTITEMLLDHGGWLSKNWREIRDLAETNGDDDIFKLLESYDIRKKHMEYLIENAPARVSHDPENSFQVRKVSTAVLRKLGTVSTMPGTWRGRKGFTLTLAALNAGASPSILPALRNAIYPVQVLLDLLRETDERHEYIQSLRRHISGHHQSLPPPVEVSDDDARETDKHGPHKSEKTGLHAVDEIRMHNTRPPPALRTSRSRRPANSDRHVRFGSSKYYGNDQDASTTAQDD